MSIGKGIPISTGFDLNSQSPLDNRTIFKTIEERDSLPNISLYEGLECFIEDTKIKYQYLNGQWEEIEIWDNVTVTKDEINNRNEISFYSKGTLKKTIYIDGIDENEIETWDDATVTKDVVNNRNEISFYSKGVLKKTIYIDGLNEKVIEYGDVAPTDENILLWVDTTSDNGCSSLLSDALILELKKIILDLNTQIADLKSRVLYLEQHGGGSGGIIEENTLMILEDGTILTFEDGTQMCLEDDGGGGTIEENVLMIFEDGTILTFEDGTQMCLE